MRWSNLLTDASADQASLPGYREAATVRHFDAPEALDTRFYEVRAKSALNRVPERSQMPFRWTVNPYRGCTHACAYCFARPTHTYLDMSPGRDFEREIVVKVNAPEVLRAELSRPSWRHEHVAMGTNTDPYQWVEGRYRLMRGIWAALRDSRTPCSVLTKSPLVLRDLDLLLEIAEVTQVSANLSIPTLDEAAWRATEPHTPSPRARFDAVRKLNEAGIPTGILVAPLMPGINDAPEQVEAILDAAADAGATSIGGIALHLRGETRDVWFDWLRAQRPDLVPRYERLYARGAYAPPAERERLATILREGKARRPELRSYSRQNLDAARPQALDAGRRRPGGQGTTRERAPLQLEVGAQRTAMAPPATFGGRALPPASERAPVPCEPHLLDRDPAPPGRAAPGGPGPPRGARREAGADGRPRAARGPQREADGGAAPGAGRAQPGAGGAQPGAARPQPGTAAGEAPAAPAQEALF